MTTKTTNRQRNRTAVERKRERERDVPVNNKRVERCGLDHTHDDKQQYPIKCRRRRVLGPRAVAVNVATMESSFLLSYRCTDGRGLPRHLWDQWCHHQAKRQISSSKHWVGSSMTTIFHRCCASQRVDAAKRCLIRVLWVGRCCDGGDDRRNSRPGQINGDL